MKDASIFFQVHTRFVLNNKRVYIARGRKAPPTHNTNRQDNTRSTHQHNKPPN
jgi:hypothetical protein